MSYYLGPQVFRTAAKYLPLNNKSSPHRLTRCGLFDAYISNDFFRHITDGRTKVTP